MRKKNCMLIHWNLIWINFVQVCLVLSLSACGNFQSEPTTQLVRELTASATGTIPSWRYASQTETPTPTPPANKHIVLLHGSMGGDGGDTQENYCGRGIPDIVLYADGHLIIYEEQGLLEKWLPSSESTDWLQRIQDADFFQLKFKLINFPDGGTLFDLPTNVPLVMGAPSERYYAEFNGMVNDVNVSSAYMNFLTVEARRATQVFETYNPSGFEPFSPKRLILWIENANGSAYCESELPALRSWPSTLPPIDSLGIGHVTVEPALIPELTKLFDVLPSEALFQDGAQRYLIIARPLLPDELASATDWGQ